MKHFQQKKAELREVQDKLAQLKAKYDLLVLKKAKIEAKIEATRVKLDRTEKLLSELGDEFERWTQSFKDQTAS
ncbi:MAG: hypothetical protein EZS28_051627 [Streblomastix strix]|uniref:Uncharacterized protein n=1 Tax=Streblomastix strix TaxID=222440 RepID=A0A5J4T340_9EUKA|nr:MAG: hypothetical protein EZS28_051627 [Streblomastix strix]